MASILDMLALLKTHLHLKCGLSIRSEGCLGKCDNGREYTYQLSTVVSVTIALHTLHFVEIEMSCCDHFLFQTPPKAPELLSSISVVLSDAIVLPKFLKFLIDFLTG